VVAAYMFFAWLAPEKSHPAWIKNAKSLVVIKGTGQWLMSMLPEDIDKYLKGFKRGTEEPQEPDPGNRTGLDLRLAGAELDRLRTPR
jgi:membrane protein required for colicin V production